MNGQKNLDALKEELRGIDASELTELVLHFAQQDIHENYLTHWRHDRERRSALGQQILHLIHLDESLLRAVFVGTGLSGLDYIRFGNSSRGNYQLVRSPAFHSIWKEKYDVSWGSLCGSYSSPFFFHPTLWPQWTSEPRTLDDWNAVSSVYMKTWIMMTQIEFRTLAEYRRRQDYTSEMRISTAEIDIFETELKILTREKGQSWPLCLPEVFKRFLRDHPKSCREWHFFSLKKMLRLYRPGVSGWLRFGKKQSDFVHIDCNEDSDTYGCIIDSQEQYLEKDWDAAEPFQEWLSSDPTWDPQLTKEEEDELEYWSPDEDELEDFSSGDEMEIERPDTLVDPNEELQALGRFYAENSSPDTRLQAFEWYQEKLAAYQNKWKARNSEWGKKAEFEEFLSGDPNVFLVDPSIAFAYLPPNNYNWIALARTEQQTKRNKWHLEVVSSPTEHAELIISADPQEKEKRYYDFWTYMNWQPNSFISTIPAHETLRFRSDPTELSNKHQKRTNLKIAVGQRFEVEVDVATKTLKLHVEGETDQVEVSGNLSDIYLRVGMIRNGTGIRLLNRLPFETRDITRSRAMSH